MDDTPRRVDRPGQTRAPAADDLTSRSTESIRGYDPSGLHVPPGTEARQASGATDTPDTDPDTDRRTGEIRRDIEQTREELAETIDAIQEKLRPGHIVSSATERVKHATTERVRQMTRSASDTASSMMDSARDGSIVGEIRHNPVPAALIGIGAAWWLMNSRSGNAERGRWTRDYRDRDYRAGEFNSSSANREDFESHGGYGAGYSRVSPRTTTPYGYGGDRSSAGLMDRVKNNPVPAALAGLGLGWLAFSGAERNDRWESERGWARRYDGGDQGEAASSTMANVKETLTDAASDVTESAREVTNRAQEYTRDATARARYTGRRAQTELDRMTRENPLAVGAGALLLGAAIGLAIPETERENELLGEARDSMIDKAQDMASTAASRAQDAASDLAGEAAKRIIGGKTE